MAGASTASSAVSSSSSGAVGSSDAQGAGGAARKQLLRKMEERNVSISNAKVRWNFLKKQNWKEKTKATEAATATAKADDGEKSGSSEQNGWTVQHIMKGENGSYSYLDFFLLVCAVAPRPSGLLGALKRSSGCGVGGDGAEDDNSSAIDDDTCNTYNTTETESNLSPASTLSPSLSTPQLSLTLSRQVLMELLQDS